MNNNLERVLDRMYKGGSGKQKRVQTKGTKEGLNKRDINYCEKEMIDPHRKAYGRGEAFDCNDYTYIKEINQNKYGFKLEIQK